jgi:hypothetical protein
MKKILAIVVMGAVAISATADITGFIFKQNAAVTDELGASYGEGIIGNIFTFRTSDGSELLGLVTPDSNANGYNEIDILDLQALVAAGSSTLTRTAKSGYTQDVQTDGDASTIGMNAIGLFSADFASLATAGVGDFIGFTAVAGPLVDLQPNLALPPNAAQILAGGAIQTNIEIIPEPATLGLMGIAGLGMFLARRKTRR